MENHPITDMKEAEAYINAIPRFTKEKHSMEDLRAMLKLLGAYPAGQKIVHVAGTNGKGSVSAMLERILREAGFSTALFTSPHLVRINERFSFDGHMVSDDRFLAAFQKVHSLEPEFRSRFGSIPTYFEYLFLIFYVLEQMHPHEYLILETGLGGRLDATTAVRPDLTVITSISFDHMQYLGDTIAAIAGEKAGILCPGVPLIYDDTNPEASAVILSRAQKLGVPAAAVRSDEIRDFAGKPGAISFTCEEAGKKIRFQVPFPAPYQAVNALIAYKAARCLGIRSETSLSGIAKTRWPGRMEEIRPGIYFDGAHNEGGVKAFAHAARAIADAHPGARKLLLFDVASDKEFRKMLDEIAAVLQPDRVYLTHMKSARAIDEKKLLDAAVSSFGSEEISFIPDASEALERASAEKKDGDLLFVAGSLYLIGELKAYLENREEISWQKKKI